MGGVAGIRAGGTARAIVERTEGCEKPSNSFRKPDVKSPYMTYVSENKDDAIESTIAE
jgi:hypothetical protein